MHENPMTSSRRFARLGLAAVACVAALAATACAAGADPPKSRFLLPEGDAAVTLRQFSQQARTPIIYPVDLVRGVKTKPVQGLFTARDALDRMVTATGLVVSQDAHTGALTVGRAATPPATPKQTLRAKAAPASPPASAPSAMTPKTAKPTSFLARASAWLALTLAPTLGAQIQPATDPAPAQDPTLVLSPFTISSTKTVGYGAAASLSSGRLAQAYVDTPQSVSVVTEEFLKDANVFSAKDSLKFVPSVAPTSSQHDAAFTIRGLRTNNVNFEGIRVGASFYLDNAFFSRIEVVKGPSGAAFGRGEPAGFINNMFKRPGASGKTSTIVDLTAGTEDNLRATIDADLPLAGGLGARLVAYRHDGSGTRELSEFDKQGAMLSVQWRYSKKGTLTVFGFNSDERLGATVGNPSYNHPQSRDDALINANRAPGSVPLLPKDQVIGFEGDGFHYKLNGLMALLEHNLLPRLFTRQALLYSDLKNHGEFTVGNIGSSQFESATTGQPEWTVTAPITRLLAFDRTFSYQGDFVYKLENLLGGNHTFVAGGDYNDLVNVAANTTFTTGRHSLLNFTNGVRPATTFPADTAVGLSTASESAGYYAQWQGAFLRDRIQASASARKQFFESTATTRATGAKAATQKAHTKLIPRYSLLYKITEQISVFGLSATQEDPSSPVLRWSQLPAGDPRATETINAAPRTELREFGAKAVLFGGKLYVSASYYEMEREGTVLPVTRNEIINGQTIPITERSISGEEISGLELEIFGEPLPRLNFTLAAGFISGTVPRPGGSGPADRVNMGVVDTVSGYVRYKFAPGSDGLSLRAGGKLWLGGWNLSAFRNNPYKGDQVQLDVGASYTWGRGRYTLDLKVNNATDEFNIVASNSTFDQRLSYLGFTARL
jgi:outer membrane receptor for ferric coprogen and ferric-rhodotorulic acid